MSEIADTIDELKKVYNKEISYLKERISHQKETLNFMAEKCYEARGATLQMDLASAGYYLKAHNAAMIKCYDAHLADSVAYLQNIIRNKLGTPTKTS
jgi:hypothetical protein